MGRRRDEREERRNRTEVKRREGYGRGGRVRMAEKGKMEKTWKRKYSGKEQKTRKEEKRQDEEKKKKVIKDLNR